MNVEEVRDYALSLPGVTEDQPFGLDNVVFRIEGKIFLCLALEVSPLGSHDAKPHFACKLPPDRNVELRERYAAVSPAWHWNKRHWSDVCYQELDDAHVKAWIGESYALVVAQLPKLLKQKYM